MESTNKTDIQEDIYESYLSSLLDGNRIQCLDIVSKQLQSQYSTKTIYEKVFKRSLYKVGELWESNKISVPSEHIATAITEGIMNRIYSDIISRSRTGKKVVISCLEQEYHQVGGKMVADIFEMNGWDTYYLGSNTPLTELVRFTNEVKPNMIGLSLSVYLHMNCLHKTLQTLKSEFPNMTILIGGQALLLVGESIATSYTNVYYIQNLDELDKFIKAVSKN